MPNFPEVEFGVNPWGQAVEPWEVAASSTDAMPIQLGDINSATMTLAVDWNVGADVGWNLAFEMWLVDGYPGDAGSTVQAECMVFFGWHSDYWPTSPRASGSFNDGLNDYVAYQDEAWPEWRYIQFRIANGPRNPPSLDITFNIMAYVDWLIGRGYSSDLWVSRFEVGNEVYDRSSGQTTIRTLTYELNGQVYDSVPAL
jgi:hypothetical protein